MYTVIDGFDRTSSIDKDTIKYQLGLSDNANKSDFDLIDTGSLIQLYTGMELLVYDEASGVPNMNLFAYSHILDYTLNPELQAVGILTSLFAYPVSSAIVQSTFINYGVIGTAFLQQATPNGYVHPGQSYMLSVYITISTPLSGCNSWIQLDFLDVQQNVIAGSTVYDKRTTTASNAQQRISISGVAPANAVYSRASLGFQITNTTNSGVLLYTSPQLEPMWFNSITYPSADCTYSQASCYTLPDGCISRSNRVFAGYIDDLIAEYDGPNRTWHVSGAGADKIADSGGNYNGDGTSTTNPSSHINITFTNQYDDQILITVINTYFFGLITYSLPNAYAPAPIVRGAFFPSITFSDVTFKDIVNTLTDTSGYTYQIGNDYRLYYNPDFYNSAPYPLSDGSNMTLDNKTAYAYYDYQFEEDATQRKRQVKILGGNFIAPAITDIFSGNGSLKTFPLTQQPYDVKYVNIGGVAQVAGVSGVNTYAQGYAVLIDKANKKIIFNTSPVTGTNNVTINYTYQAPVSAVTIDQNAANTPVAPPYVVPTFVQKVNDSSITDITTAITRGLAELTKYAKPRVILTFKTQQFLQPGWIVYFTSARDNIVNTGFVIWTVSASVLGSDTTLKSFNQYEIQAGSYNPLITDHIRHHNKALNKSTTTANINYPQRIDLVFGETIMWSESITFTHIAPNPGTYGAGTYGSTTFS